MLLQIEHDTNLLSTFATSAQNCTCERACTNALVQVFELWERKSEARQSKHYVRVLYNKEPLSLAKHPQGQWTYANATSCLSAPAVALPLILYLRP